VQRRLQDYGIFSTDHCVVNLLSVRQWKVLENQLIFYEVVKL